MKKVLLALSLSAVLVLSACSDDGDGGDAATASSTTAAATEEAASDTTAGAESGCTGLAASAAPEVARLGFPDNPDVTWTVAAVETDDEGLLLVEIVPDPDEVGYPAFRLAMTCDADEEEVTELGTYALDDGTWILLSTTDAPGAADLEPTLP